MDFDDVFSPDDRDEVQAGFFAEMTDHLEIGQQTCLHDKPRRRVMWVRRVAVPPGEVGVLGGPITRKWEGGELSPAYVVCPFCGLDVY